MKKKELMTIVGNHCITKRKHNKNVFQSMPRYFAFHASVHIISVSQHSSAVPRQIGMNKLKQYKLFTLQS